MNEEDGPRELRLDEIDACALSLGAANVARARRSCSASTRASASEVEMGSDGRRGVPPAEAPRGQERRTPTPLILRGKGSIDAAGASSSRGAHSPYATTLRNAAATMSQSSNFDAAAQQDAWDKEAFTARRTECLRGLPLTRGFGLRSPRRFRFADSTTLRASTGSRRSTGGRSASG